MFTEKKIELEHNKVFQENPSIELIAPCKINEGVVHFLQVQKDNLISKFEQTELNCSFFIPASGSGSRMFQFLHDFLNKPTEENRGQFERFLNNIESFAFFNTLPQETKKNLRSHNVNLDEFVLFLLANEGMNFGNIPKGMVPFHKHGPFILNPFQEHVLQGKRLLDRKIDFHFTINKKFETIIQEGINYVNKLSGNESSIYFSEQKIESNAIAFTPEGETIPLENGEILSRPAGHGALLANLNEVDSDLIFIKNIDNIQHYSKSNSSIETMKYLGGIAIWLKEEIKKILENPSLESLHALNKHFELFSKETLSDIEEDDIPKLLNRPFRVCGMVRNDGQPGGGPFWVKENGKLSKQIIEKAQLSSNADQYRLMVQSTYFNPVLIVASTKDSAGKKFDLMQFQDESKYFVVEKNFNGKQILFSELPGLWNGSMAHWNTVFVEIPSNSFSPVKTILDLINERHME